MSSIINSVFLCLFTRIMTGHDEKGGKRTFQCYDPSQHTMELFEEVQDEDHVPHDLFCQMDVLRPYGDDMVWKEMVR